MSFAVFSQGSVQSILDRKDETSCQDEFCQQLGKLMKIT